MLHTCDCCLTCSTQHRIKQKAAVGRAVALEDLRWNARIKFQLHSMFGQPPPAYFMTSGCDDNDDECGLAVFCQLCAFLQLAAEWKVWS